MRGNQSAQQGRHMTDRRVENTYRTKRDSGGRSQWQAVARQLSKNLVTDSGTLRRSLAMMLLFLAFSPAVLAESKIAWVPWSGMLPRGAVEGGLDNNWTTPLYVCRGTYTNGVHPGKLVPGGCSIGWGGNEVTLRKFEVLVFIDERDSRRGHYDPRRR